MPVFLLSEALTFPSPELAEDDGLLAVGGDLTEERLLLAYRMGIFPWFSEDDPILWWSPDPRLILYPAEFHLSKRLLRTIRANRFRITADTAFVRVMEECARIRLEQGQQTWINSDMIDAYTRLYRNGHAHSVEAWVENYLAGGLYGVAIGNCFFGESMFSRITDASKVAFAFLVNYLGEKGFDLIDCQVTTGHLKRLGAREVPRKQFLKQLAVSVAPAWPGGW
ncbi:MAG: leucyl/phenylalanyl-tRNA--protein transferase [Thermodesulfobacteriota bacterium]